MLFLYDLFHLLYLEHLYMLLYMYILMQYTSLNVCTHPLLFP